ncbi:MAG: ion channel [Burkholderiales bacterium]
MPDPLIVAQAAATSPSAPATLGTTLSQDAAGIARVPSDLVQLPFLQHLAQAIPAADVAFGGTVLLLIVLIHAAGVRTVTNHVARRARLIMQRPRIWRVDVLMATSVLSLLLLHLTETVVWAAALVYGGLVPSWRAAGFFAGNTYTTVGYGNFVLPAGWEMVAPIIAISGLFTFGWSGSVLVDIVARCQRIKDTVVDRAVGNAGAGGALPSR